MIDWLIIIVGVFLLFASIIDWKYRALPSIMLTAMLFVVAVLNPANLWLGIYGFIIALLLYEAEFFSGIADLKVMTTMAFMLSSINFLFVFILLVVFYGFIWKVLLKWRYKKEPDIPFIPVFLFIFSTIGLLGGFR